MTELTPEHLEQAKRLTDLLMHYDAHFMLSTAVLNMVEVAARKAGFDTVPDDDVVMAVLVGLGTYANDWEPTRRAEAARRLTVDLVGAAVGPQDQPAHVPLTPDQEEQGKLIIDKLIVHDVNLSLCDIILNALASAAKDAGVEGEPDPAVIVAVMSALGDHSQEWEPGRRFASVRDLGEFCRETADREEEHAGRLTSGEVDKLWSEHTQGAKPGEGGP